jgi:hypothetical protein
MFILLFVSVLVFATPTFASPSNINQQSTVTQTSTITTEYTSTSTAVLSLTTLQNVTYAQNATTVFSQVSDSVTNYSPCYYYVADSFTVIKGEVILGSVNSTHAVDLYLTNLNTFANWATGPGSPSEKCPPTSGIPGSTLLGNNVTTYQINYQVQQDGSYNLLFVNHLAVPTEVVWNLVLERRVTQAESVILYSTKSQVLTENTTNTVPMVYTVPESTNMSTYLVAGSVAVIVLVAAAFLFKRKPKP